MDHPFDEACGLPIHHRDRQSLGLSKEDSLDVSVRAFRLSDILLLRRLGSRGMRLDLETALLGRNAPLWETLLGRLPLRGRPSFTYMLEERGSVGGFIQARSGQSGLDCDVVFMAPSLDGVPDGPDLWKKLLAHLVREMGERGVHLLFARVPTWEEEAIDVLREEGFGAYTRRQIFRLDPALASSASDQTGASWRRRSRRDDWGLRRLYRTVTPRLVQQAEGLERHNRGLMPTSVWIGGRMREYVAERDGELIAYLRMLRGPEGHWLRAIIHPEAEEEGVELLSQMLPTSSDGLGRPLYCAAREYELGLKRALEETGFRPFAEELLMVKHTTAVVGAPEVQTVSGLEREVEGVTTATRSPARRDRPREGDVA